MQNVRGLGKARVEQWLADITLEHPSWDFCCLQEAGCYGDMVTAEGHTAFGPKARVGMRPTAIVINSRHVASRVSKSHRYHGRASKIDINVDHLKLRLFPAHLNPVQNLEHYSDSLEHLATVLDMEGGKDRKVLGSVDAQTSVGQPRPEDDDRVSGQCSFFGPSPRYSKALGFLQFYPFKRFLP